VRAPLIDIVFQLLIFFMLTSTLAVQDRLDVDLPVAESGREQSGGQIEVLITRNGEMAVNNVRVPRDGLAEALRNALAGGAASLTVKADAGTRTAEVVHVLREARGAGITNVTIATRLVASP
jgi:biopolymer transport protein ExbD